jgi:hypothetical protein
MSCSSSSLSTRAVDFYLAGGCWAVFWAALPASDYPVMPRNLEQVYTIPPVVSNM